MDYRLKEEVDSLDLQNVEHLTDDMKTACPTLDNIEINHYVESTCEPSKDSDDKENQDIGNENSLDRICRRPVESWKYQPLKAENNRTSYKCSLCCSVYLHKKSLNKHWKDKHSVNNQNSGSQDHVLSTMNMNSPSIYAGTSFVIYPNRTESHSFSVKNESTVPQLFNSSENFEEFDNKMNRKRQSLQLINDDNNKENCSIVPIKRLSVVQPLSTNNLPLVLRPINNNFKCMNNVAVNNNHLSASAPDLYGNVLDLRKPNNGALDLRTTLKPVGFSKIYFRCFQCTFRSGTMFELNEHFRMLHQSIFCGIKSFQIPVSLYQKLLLNQFDAIIRADSESLETLNGRTNCCLCGLIFPTRYEMIQHIGTAHEMEMIWICPICGFGCCHPFHLSHHFQSHSSIQMVTKPMPIYSWSGTQVNSGLPHIGVIQNNESQIEKFVPPDFENHLANSTPISGGNKYKRITSKKEPVIIDAFNAKEKTLKCLVCDATARWRSELFTHMITHSEHRSFGCKFCSYRSKWKWDVPKHLKRCRLAPPHVRKPDVQNSYLITLLQHYSPPPGDILFQFMKEYNIKDIGSLNKSMCIKNENEDDFHVSEQLSTSVEINIKPEFKNDNVSYEATYENISEASEDDELNVDVGTDLTSDTKDNSISTELALKYTFKHCPWCQGFLTNKPSEMSNHLAQYHTDLDSGPC